MARFVGLPPAGPPEDENLPYPSDEFIEKEFPAIYEYISEQVAGPQGWNTTPTVLVTRERGAWKACLNDRPRNRSLWREGSSIMGALAALERDLQTGGTGWRFYPTEGGNKKPRR